MPARQPEHRRQTLIVGVAVAVVLVLLAGVGGGLALAGVFDSGSSTPTALAPLQASWGRYVYVRTAAAKAEQADRLRNKAGAVRLDFGREGDAARGLAFEVQAIKFPSAVRSAAEAFRAAAGKYLSEVRAAAADASPRNVNVHAFAVGQLRAALDAAYYRLVLGLQAQ